MTRATVVLVHGPCLGPWVWDDGGHGLRPRLESRGLRCFAPDLHEAWPTPHWSPQVARLPLARYVDRLHQMLARLEGPTILVGHSMGARVVEGLIARGARDGAVLISPTPPDGLEAAARGLAARHPAAFAGALIARRPLRLLGEPGRSDPTRVRELLLGARASEALVARVAATLRDESFAACLDWLRPHTVTRDALVPVLAISGRDDALVTPAALRRTAVAWDAVAHVVPHAGHCPMLGDGASIVARHIERWLFDD